jgi:hypothetical protein
MFLYHFTPMLHIIYNLLVLLTILLLLRMIRKRYPAGSGYLVEPQQQPTQTGPQRPQVVVAFTVREEPDWKVLLKVVEIYRRESQEALQSLSRALETALAFEERLALSKGTLSQSLQERIERLAAIYEQDADTLQRQILQPFQPTKVLGDTHDNSNAYPMQDDTPCLLLASSSSNITFPLKQPKDPSMGAAVYDSAVQVMAHLARDWSEEGHSVRFSVYTWCHDQLAAHNNSGSLNATTSVLVPGAGVGVGTRRLARTSRGSIRGHGCSCGQYLAGAAYKNGTIAPVRPGFLQQRSG